MKKSRLFSLVAMTALFAACQQEDFVTPNEAAKVDLGNRPEIGAVSVKIGGNAETRMGIKDGASYTWAYVDGDKVGAAIIDVPLASSVSNCWQKDGAGTWSSKSFTYADYVNGTKTWGEDGSARKYGFLQTKTAEEGTVNHKAVEMYTVVENISSNYPYELKNGTFTTQANLVEGNYMFYAPYNSSNLMRKPVAAVLPMKQDCSDEVMKDTKYMKGDAKVSSTSIDKFFKGTTEGFENAPVAVGYQFLAAPSDPTKVIEPKVEMRDLYAYPMITIVNNFNGFLFDGTNLSSTTSKAYEMTLDSIQIYSNTPNAIVYQASINSANLKAKLSEAQNGNLVWDNERFSTSATKDVFASTLNTTNDPYFKANYFVATDNSADTKIGASEYKQQHVTCTFGAEGKSLKQGEVYHFHAVLPAANYGKTLFARIFVKIDGKRYVLQNISTALTVNTTETSPNYGKATYASGKGDWNFRDVVNGDMDVRLVRAQHYPAPELYEDGSGSKAFAGKMMTITLAGGLTQAAFALKEDVVTYDYGFVDNDDFISYMTDYVQRGVYLKDYTDKIGNVARSLWKVTDVDNNPSTVTTEAGAFAFADPTECIIDAELVGALKEKMVQTTGVGDVMDLSTNIGIAKDVTIVAPASGTVYTFSTLDGTKSYKIDYKYTPNTDATALKTGLNLVGTTSQASAVTKTLAVGADNKDVAVILNGADRKVTTATLNDCTGINIIYVNANTVLNVNTVCDALVVMNGGSIVMGAEGKLTNTNNKFNTGSINNNNLRQIEGTVATGVVISASSSAWPTTALAANTMINQYTVNPNSSTANIDIDQAQIDIFSNLTGVTIKLGANITTSITSTANVTLNKIKKITSLKDLSTGANKLKWNLNGAGTISIVQSKNGVIDSAKIETGDNVSFTY